jgi:hypothetical protein
MPDLTCWDCNYHEPDAPWLGYCSHPQTAEFEEYFNNADQSGAATDASDCAGFEASDYEGDRHVSND